MRMPNLTNSEGVRAWIKACGFRTDEEAYTAMGWNYRTYYRYKANGIPGRALGEAIKAQMVKALEERAPKRKSAKVMRKISKTRH